MTDDNRKQEDMLKRVTRRYMLRNSSIAATGIILLPSFITSCKKDDITRGPGGGVRDQLSPSDLLLAATNLTRMRQWVTDLYPLCIEYEDAVFHALAATKQTGGWTNFIVDIFIDIATALAAAAAIASGAGAAVPAFAFLSAILHDWGIGKDKPTNLDEEFASFEFGHVRMQFAIEQKLSSLVDPKNNYSNLTAAWQDPIDGLDVPPFKGNTYTIGDLASSVFPALGDDYNALQTAAVISFQQALWNLVIMKCCTYKVTSTWTIDLYYDGENSVDNNHFSNLLPYAQEVMYPQNKGMYLRGAEGTRWDTYRYVDLRSWQLGIDGNPFPDDACNQLFKDDTPGHIINPNGLFNRSYVFQQFALTKPTMLLRDPPYYPNWYELGTDYPQQDFQENNDWEFKGGAFKDLTH